MSLVQTLSRTLACCCLSAVLLISLGWQSNLPAAPPRLPHVAPSVAGMNQSQLDQIDTVVTQALDQGKMPGCVVLVGRGEQIVYLKAFGNRRLLPTTEPMTTDTVFDLASLTKPIATATSAMLLVERGKLALADPVSKHWPAFATQDKSRITLADLLLHQSGLIADNALGDYLDGQETAMNNIAALSTRTAPGEKFVYSDVGFITLGEVVRRSAGEDLHAFTQANLFGPLGMTETGYLPGEMLRNRAAPTEQRDGVWMQGEVHDPRAFEMGSIAGHAGLFSTAEDLAIYAAMLLGNGQYAGVRVLAPETVELMTTAHTVSSGQRGLGWDMQTGYSSNRGTSFSPQAFGHGGFTGTSIWIDPASKLFVIFLSNRVHPDGKGSVNPLAGAIGTIVGESLTTNE